MQEMQEMWVLSWGREVSLVKEMATHSSILAWEISWTEESGGRGMVHGGAESGMTEHTCAHTHRHTHTHFSDSFPLQVITR